MNLKISNIIINKGECNIKKTISLIVSMLLIMLIPMEALAATDFQHEKNIFLLDDISEIGSCVLRTNTSYKETSVLDNKTMSKILSLDGSNVDKCEEIFENIGIKYIEGSSKQQEIVQNLDNIKRITSSASYVKICEDGTQVLLSEKQCLDEISKTNEINDNNGISRSSIISDNAEPKTSDNGYMKMVVGYFYKGNGYFTIASQWEWLKEPTCRFKDAFSLFTTEMIWNNTGTKSYERVIYYTRESNGLGKEDVVESSSEDPVIESSGVYYTWNLPNDAISSDDVVRNYDFMCQMWATARVQDYDDYTQYLDIYTTYIHKKVALIDSYSIAYNRKGVSLSLSGVSQIVKQTYTHYFGWNYIDPAREAGEV